MNIDQRDKSNATPPKWAGWLLTRFCSSYSLEEVQGDLEELFRERVQKLGEKEAKSRYVRDVMSLINPLSLKESHSQRMKHHQRQLVGH